MTSENQQRIVRIEDRQVQVSPGETFLLEYETGKALSRSFVFSQGLFSDEKDAKKVTDSGQSVWIRPVTVSRQAPPIMTISEVQLASDSTVMKTISLVVSLGDKIKTEEKKLRATITLEKTGYINGTRVLQSLVDTASGARFVDDKKQVTVNVSDADANAAWRVADYYVKRRIFHAITAADKPAGGDRGIDRFFYDGKAADPGDVAQLTSIFNEKALEALRRKSLKSAPREVVVTLRIPFIDRHEEIVYDTRLDKYIYYDRANQSVSGLALGEQVKKNLLEILKAEFANSVASSVDDSVHRTVYFLYKNRVLDGNSAPRLSRLFNLLHEKVLSNQ